jgi:TonB-dependent receptor
VNGSIQWKPNNDLQFYFDGLYQGFRNRVSDRRLFVPLFGDGRFTNVVLGPGANQVQSLTADNVVAPFLFQGATTGETDTYQFAVGGIYDSGPLRISADLARTDSKFTNSIGSFDTFFVRNPTVDVNFNVPRGPGGVEFSFRNFDTNDVANFNFGGFFEGYQIARGDDYQARLDVSYETGFDIIPEIEAGVRFADRDGSFEDGFRFGNQNGGRPLSQIPVDLRISPRGFRGSDIQPVRTWVTPRRRSIRENIPELRELVGFTPGRAPTNPGSVFEANEKSYTAYAQLRYEFELGNGATLDGNIGLRAVKTEFSIEDVNGTDDNEITDYLPNASARIDFGSGIQARFGYTQTRTRAGFSDLRPIVLNSPDPCLLLPPAQRPPSSSCFQTGQGGNPDLDPVNSNNYDASLEYYFARNGFASLGIFRRDFRGFVNRLNFRTDSPEFGPDRLVLNIPVNAGRGRIQGFEAQVQTFFDFEFVPEFVRGFGIQANVTYLDDEQAIPDAPGAQADEQFGIPDVSRWTYNVVGLYERGGLTARLAYNRRSNFIDFFDVTADGRIAGEFTRGTSRLDFSTSYTLFENLTLTFDASNILGKPFRNFRNYDENLSFPRDVRYEESIYAIGVRFRL